MEYLVDEFQLLTTSGPELNESHPDLAQWLAQNFAAPSTTADGSLKNRVLHSTGNSNHDSPVGVVEDLQLRAGAANKREAQAGDGGPTRDVDMCTTGFGTWGIVPDETRRLVQLDDGSGDGLAEDDRPTRPLGGAALWDELADGKGLVYGDGLLGHAGGGNGDAFSNGLGVADADAPLDLLRGEVGGSPALFAQPLTLFPGACLPAFPAPDQTAAPFLRWPSAPGAPDWSSAGTAQGGAGAPHAPTAPPNGTAPRQDAPDDLEGKYPVAPRGLCSHRKHWERMRGKRGFSYFMCGVCGNGWRQPIKKSKNQPPSPPSKAQHQRRPPAGY